MSLVHLNPSNLSGGFIVLVCGAYVRLGPSKADSNRQILYRS